MAALLLLNLTDDINGDVAFEALSIVAFYCGVNSYSEGVFIDASIRDPEFLALARVSASLGKAIKRLSIGSASCGLVARFRLLAEEINS